MARLGPWSWRRTPRSAPVACHSAARAMAPRLSEVAPAALRLRTQFSPLSNRSASRRGRPPRPRTCCSLARRARSCAAAPRPGFGRARIAPLAERAAMRLALWRHDCLWMRLTRCELANCLRHSPMAARRFGNFCCGPRDGCLPARRTQSCAAALRAADVCAPRVPLLLGLARPRLGGAPRADWHDLGGA